MPSITDKAISCFYDSSDDCIKVLSIDGVLMSFNDNGIKIMEIDQEADVIGKSWLSFWKGELRKPAEAALKKAQAGHPASFDGYCPTAKGTMKHWHVSLVPLFDESNNVGSILVTSKDTTELDELRQKVSSLEKVLATQHSNR